MNHFHLFFSCIHFSAIFRLPRNIKPSIGKMHVIGVIQVHLMRCFRGFPDYLRSMKYFECQLSMGKNSYMHQNALIFFFPSHWLGAQN